MNRRDVGVTVMPEYFQNEGVAGVLDNLLRRAGATAVATSPYVMAPAAEGEGSREPPLDAGAGSVRHLDRPLWGQRALVVRTAPSFVPDRALYRGLRYQPAAPNALTHDAGGIVAEAIRAARMRGLDVYLQVQAAIPPGYRVQFGGPEVEDRPCLPDGSAPARRVDNNGSLASPHIRAYGAALLRDLVRSYPDIAGIRVDWPEYPPYSLDAVFFDFSPHARAAARRLGFEAEAMRREAAACRAFILGELTAAMLQDWLSAPAAAAEGVLRRFPAMRDLAAFKTKLVGELLVEFRAALDDVGGRRIKLVANGFPPPFCRISGFAYTEVARHVDAIGVKLYTMHWPMILRAVGEAIAAATPALADEPALVRCLVRVLDIADDEGLPCLSDYRYPEPDEPHPVGSEVQRRKIETARAEAGGIPVYALAHGYGPVEDVVRRAGLAFAASGGRLWLNRYGYLADAKLDAIGRLHA